MARMVLGMAVPHSGMLGKAPEAWFEDGERDRKKEDLWFRNRMWTYAQLEKHRVGDGFRAPLSIEERRARAQRCWDALDELRRIYREVKPDVAVILGKDQREIFIDTTPSIAIYTGKTIENGPPQRPVYAPARTLMHAALPELALYLTASLEQVGFDITEIVRWPPNVWLKQQPVVPHAFGFIYHQIMVDQPPPNVPILMNTFYPPTQPPFRRALAFGQALFKAIQDWDTEKTVAIIASGGLSHFVCDEELDRVFLSAFETYDFERLAQVDERSYQSGTSEVKLYVPVLIAMQELGCRMDLIDYVPCYRTEAGTGEGFAFMSWAPAART
ncbi:MAG: protocatechuate 3,4-dioxygenase [Chloroflexota bacterium]